MRNAKLYQNSKSSINIKVNGVQSLTLSNQPQESSLRTDGGQGNSNPSITLETYTNKLPGCSETSISEVHNRTSSLLGNIKSADNLASISKEMASKFQLPLNKHFLAPLFDNNDIKSFKDLNEQLEMSPINKKSDFLNAKLILKNIDSKEKLRVKQQPISVISVAKKENNPHDLSPSKIVSPDKIIKTNSFSLKPTYFTHTTSKKPALVNFSVGGTSPRKFTVNKEAPFKQEGTLTEKNIKSSKFGICFNKKFSEADLKSRDKSREFKISFSRVSSQANVRVQRDALPGGSCPNEILDSSPIEASTPSKHTLNGSFTKATSIKNSPVSFFPRTIERVSYSKIGIVENKQPERLTTFSPFAIQKAWTDKEEFVLEHQRAIKRNLANRRMRILQSSINLLEKEQIGKDSGSVSPVKKMTKKKV